MRCPICDGQVEVTGTVMVNSKGKKVKKNPTQIKRYRKCTNCGNYNPVTFEQLPTESDEEVGVRASPANGV